MRIESAPQSRQEYRKSTDRAAPAASFGQAMRTAQDRYVPGTRPQPVQTGAEFSRVKPADGRVTVSNATQAKLKRLAELDKQSDYTGMSYDEIYAEIWNRYDEAFDGNMIAIKAYIAGPAEWTVINQQFYTEITHHIFNPAIIAARKEGLELDGRPYTEWTDAEMDALNSSSRDKATKIVNDAKLKVLGYDGMNFEEREAAIREKYAGKNTTLDFLNMQSELSLSGVLRHKMGKERAGTYCAILNNQFESAFNPNYYMTVGDEKSSFMTPDQWYRVANQPFNTAQFAAAMKDNLHRVSGHNGWTEDYVKMMEGFFDHFITGAVDGSLDRLLRVAD